MGDELMKRVTAGVESDAGGWPTCFVLLALFAIFTAAVFG